MKKTTLVLIMCMITNFAFSQTTDIGVRKSMYGIQAGVFGIWVYNEARLNKEFVLRSEIGLDGGYSYSDNRVIKSQLAFLPSLSLEPRWYYNFEKRVKKGRSILNNGANFVSLKIGYNPNWFALANFKEKNLSGSGIFSIVPYWGIRRDLGSNFDFSLKLGYGLFVFKNQDKKGSPLEGGLIPNFSVRFGYSF